MFNHYEILMLLFFYCGIKREMIDKMNNKINE